MHNSIFILSIRMQTLFFSGKIGSYFFIRDIGPNILVPFIRRHIPFYFFIEFLRIVFELNLQFLHLRMQFVHLLHGLKAFEREREEQNVQ